MRVPFHGNGIATLVVARWGKDLDERRLAAELEARQKQQESR